MDRSRRPLRKKMMMMMPSGYRQLTNVRISGSLNRPEGVEVSMNVELAAAGLDPLNSPPSSLVSFCLFWRMNGRKVCKSATRGPGPVVGPMCA
ncbi:hypothetical protein LZ30DRAFT_720214 [Colletotrichum cereale]|nr:hypothetical protein LZ30DRAFT_720214 [Colletotrichum cereale]